MRDYKSPYAVVMFICVTVVNIQTETSQTHTETAFDQFIWIAQPAELKPGDPSKHRTSGVPWSFAPHSLILQRAHYIISAISVRQISRSTLPK